MSAPDALALPGIPKDAEGPVFAEPWQAQAFAMTLQLHERGAFTWSEWAAALSDEIAQALPDHPGGYYGCWLAALERLSLDRRLTSGRDLSARKEAWAEAYRRTPHGQPVELRGPAQ